MVPLSEDTNPPLKAIEKWLSEHKIETKELQELCKMNNIKSVDARGREMPEAGLKAELLTKLSTATGEKIAATQAFLDGLEVRTSSSNKGYLEAPEGLKARQSATSRGFGAIHDPLTTASGFATKAPPIRTGPLAAVEEPLLDELSQDPGQGIAAASIDEDAVELSQAQSLARKAAGHASPIFLPSSDGTQEDVPGTSAADDSDRADRTSSSNDAAYGLLQWRVRHKKFFPTEKTDRYGRDKYGRIWYAWEVVPEELAKGWNLGPDGVMTPDGQSMDGGGDRFRYVIGLCDPNHIHHADEEAADKKHPPPQKDVAVVEAERKAAREAEREACIVDGIERIKNFLATSGIALEGDELQTLRTWLEHVWDRHRAVPAPTRGPSAGYEAAAPRRSERLRKRNRDEQAGGDGGTVARERVDERPATKKQRRNPRRTTRPR
ncbi:hypothetical protein PsYK624_075540 [Phanerochaete sordida]|uniref:Uncharacterized protein n=1 Tax=Phanerochaete sordida TaxID=48140 RepID=A0A9P3LEA3_9APHY|nr:hypothetical protein PsYK624_075540 [Phanerochaete sordida]